MDHSRSDSAGIDSPYTGLGPFCTLSGVMAGYVMKTGEYGMVWREGDGILGNRGKMRETRESEEFICMREKLFHGS